MTGLWSKIVGTIAGTTVYKGSLLATGLRTVTEGLALGRAEVARGDLSEVRVVLAREVEVDADDVKADRGTLGGSSVVEVSLRILEVVGLTMAARGACLSLELVALVGILLVAILTTGRRNRISVSSSRERVRGGTQAS